MSVITIDFETYYGKDLSLNNMTYEDYMTSPLFQVLCVGVKVDHGPTEVVWGMEAMQERFNELFPPGNHNTVICFNAFFDGPILEWMFHVEPKEYLDPQAMSRLLYPSNSNSLASTTQLVFPNDKSIRKTYELENFKGVRREDFTDEQKETMSTYCKNDVDITHAITWVMLKWVPNQELQVISLTTKMYTHRPWTVDTDLLIDFIDKEKTQRQERIKASGLSASILASSDQLAAWVLKQGIEFEKIDSPTKRNPDHKKWPFAKDSDEFIDLQKRHPEHKAVWEARLAVASNINLTRAERIINHQRYHKDFNPNQRLGAPLSCYAAHTHRWGGTNRINLMNLPRGSDLRKALIAPEGYQVVVHDQSNIEARILAYLAQCTALNDMYKNKEDVYCKFGEIIYKRPIIKGKDTLERYVAKTCVLGLGFQVGPKTLQRTLFTGTPSVPMDFSECLNLVRTYRTTYKEIPRLWGAAKHALIAMTTLIPESKPLDWGPIKIHSRALELPDGTYLQYPRLRATEPDISTGELTGGLVYWNGKFDKHTFPGSMVENVCQALARIIIADNFITASRWLKEHNAGEMALLVHDELVAIVANEHVDAYQEYTNTIMRVTPKWADASLTLDVESGHDRCYSK